jgi:hypothetical protein
LLLLAMIAAADLAAGRLALRTIRPNDVIERNRKVAAGARRDLSPERIEAASDEAGFVINRVAARMPWRSDCLVQALAGQRWLARAGIASEIVVGATKDEAGAVAAHAWLRTHGRIVLGGDIKDYRTLLDPQAATRQRR